MRKTLLLCGILAPIVYVATVVLGGLLRPGFNHIAQVVSELIASGAPNKSLLDPMFGIYNLLTISFGFGLLQGVRTTNVKRGQVVGTLGAVVLVAEGIFGFLTLFFPQDPGSISQATSTGTMHIVLAGLSSLTTMLTMLLMGFWFRGAPLLERYSAYSFISVGAVFLSGGLAAASIASNSPVGGLAERVTIGGFLQWLLVIAWALYKSEAATISTKS